MYKRLLLTAALAASMCGCVELPEVETGDVARSDAVVETNQTETVQNEATQTETAPSETAQEEAETSTQDKVAETGAAEASQTRDMAMPYTSDAQATPGDGLHLFAPAEWPENDVTANVPMPRFAAPLTDVTVSTNSVHVEWEGIGESEAASYVEDLKQAGFVYQFAETRGLNMYTFNASDAEVTQDGTKTVSVYYSRYPVATDTGEETDERQLTFSMDVSVCDWMDASYYE